MYDAVQLLAKALNELDRNQEVTLKSLTCDGFDSWNHGLSLANYIKMVIDSVAEFSWFIFQCAASFHRSN